MPTAGRLALAALSCAGAAGPAFGGLSLVSYAVGSPDSPRYFVGLYALAALLLAGALLYVAGWLLTLAEVRPPWALPALGALAVVPLVVLSIPLAYDQDPPAAALVLATAGVITGGTALSARAPRRAPVLGGAALAAFYAVCLLLDASTLLPDSVRDGGEPAPPVVSPRPVLPFPSG